jgi:hypothetical protein
VKIKMAVLNQRRAYFSQTIANSRRIELIDASARSCHRIRNLVARCAIRLVVGAGVKSLFAKQSVEDHRSSSSASFRTPSNLS